jgi:hypothetical protein
MPDLPPQDHPFRRADALATGLTRRQLQSTRFSSLFKGVHLPTDVSQTLGVRCRAALLAVPEGTVLSHYTAAQLYRLPVPDETLIHVSTTAVIEPRIRGVIAHRVRPAAALREIDGMSVTSPARTFVDMAGRLDLSGLVALGDAILHRKLADVAELQSEIALGHGQRGVRLARAALPYLESGAESPHESNTRMLAVTSGLPRPKVQVLVRDAAGGWLVPLDIGFVEYRVGIDCEGDQHRVDERQWARDIRRGELLAAEGWLHLRITSVDTRQRKGPTVERMRNALNERGWNGKSR